MNTINKIILYTGIVSCLNSCYKNQTNVNTLEKTIDSLKEENYELHLKIIKNNEPDKWKINCDELGGCWYEKIIAVEDKNRTYKYIPIKK